MDRSDLLELSTSHKTDISDGVIKESSSSQLFSQLLRSNLTSESVFRMSEEKRTEIQRASLEKNLNQRGEILNSTHIFSETVFNICKKLGITDEDLKIYVVDTEDEYLAFYDPEAKAIAIGKGIFSSLSRNGLVIAEDHIAAIIAHEFTHSQRHEREEQRGKTATKDKYKSSFAYQIAGHNKEHEADRRAMEILAEHGYNPKAVIEVISHFSNLEEVGISFSHPPDLERINHLKDILYDDKHPLANTDKELIELSKELLDWFNSPSDEVYHTTDENVRSQSEQLREKILNASSVEEFLVALRFYRHAKNAERARALVQSGLIDEVTRRSLIMMALTQNEVIWQGRYSKPNPLYNYEARYSYQNDHKLVEVVVGRDDINLPRPRFIMAQPYRQQHKPDSIWLEGNKEQIGRKIRDYLLELDKIFQDIIESNSFLFKELTSEEIVQIDQIRNKYHLVSSIEDIDALLKEIANYKKTAGKEEDIADLLALEENLTKRQIASYFKDIYEQGKNVDATILKTCFPFRDRAVTEEEIAKEVGSEESTKPKLSESLKEKFLSTLDNLEEEREKYIEGVKESIAMRVTRDVEVVEDCFLAHLGELLVKEANIASESKIVVAKFILASPEEAKSLVGQISNQDLTSLIHFLPSLVSINNGRISPRREMHNAYKQSYLDGVASIYDFEKEETFNNGEIDKRIRQIIAFELMERANLDPRKEKPLVSDFSLTLSDWRLLAELVPEKAQKYYEAKALEEMVKAYEEGEEPREEVWDVIGDVTDLKEDWDFKVFPYEQLNLSPSQIRLLLEKSPWGFEYTQKYLSVAVSNLIINSFEASSAEQRDVIDLAGCYFGYIEDHPLPLGRYNINYYQYVNQIRLSAIDLIYKTYFRVRDQLIKELTKQAQEDIVGETGVDINKIVLDNGCQAAEDSILLATQLGIIRCLGDLYKPSLLELRDSFFERLLLTANSKRIEELVDKLNKISFKERSTDFSIQEALNLLSLFPPLSEEQFSKYCNSSFGEDRKNFDDRILVYLGLVRGEIHPVLARKIFELHQERAIQWIKENFHRSTACHRLAATVIMAAPQEVRESLYLEWIKEEGLYIQPDFNFDYLHPYSIFSKASSRFNRLGYNFGNKQFSGQDLWATTEEEYRDITLRRHPFRTVAFSVDDLDFSERDDLRYCFPSDSAFSYDYRYRIGDYSNRGNLEQRLVAEMLYSIQDRLIDPKDSFENRLALLQEYCPFTTVVRDIHLERMIRLELQQSRNDPESCIARCKHLLTLFSSDEFKENYAGQVLELEIQNNPELIKEADSAVDFIVQHLPKPSLKRNYYLTMIENQCELTLEQAERIRSLKLTEELETQEGEGYWHISIINHISNILDRVEKRKFCLWLLKLYKDKPKTILEQEFHLDAIFDSLPNLFIQLTPPERELILKKFLLGQQGVIDLTQAHLFSGDALDNRRKFFERVAEELIPDNLSNSQLFRRIFITILEEAEPTRSADIVCNLLNKFIDSKKAGKEFNAAQVLSTALCSLGVVGKKVAQSLAEQEWVPADFQKALSESQEGADRVPKGSLIEIARLNGLFKPESGVQILSIGSLLGAASNKQSCLVRAKINDSTVAQRLGCQVGEVVELVAKFKRPSALKTEVLQHDIDLLAKIMVILEEEGVAKQLPRDFVKRIKSAIEGELDFQEEMEFNQIIKPEVSQRNHYRGYKIDLPTVVFTTNDVIFETRAKGRSLRDIIDEYREANIPESSIDDKLKDIRMVVLREALYQLLKTGNLHADLHPGNVFVDEDGKTITLLDWGMHAKIGVEGVIAARYIFLGLALGSEKIVRMGLKKFGWNINGNKLLLKPLNFTANAKKLLSASKESELPPPQDLSMVIIAISKLEPYTRGLKITDILDIEKMVDNMSTITFSY